MGRLHRAKQITAIAILLATPQIASGQADRYGGAWNEGEATGPFVPLGVGMNFEDLKAYQGYWSEFRITDLELVTVGCPAEKKDQFASQWEKGKWTDKLELYKDETAFENGLVTSCEDGFVLVDFEVWDTLCEETQRQYVALFQKGSCKEPPTLVSSPIFSFEQEVKTMNANGHNLVDHELVGTFDPKWIMGVFYPGPAMQRFGVFDRETFEKEMKVNEGTLKLTDMESFLLHPPRGLEKWVDPARMIIGLWEDGPGSVEDDHEVGEVYGKFRDLLFKHETKRRLVDFEIYPNTFDTRFSRTFEKYFSGTSVGYGFSVVQAGEEISSGADGWAVRPDPANNTYGKPMTPSSIHVSASVTKFITALGVMRFADTITNEDWLDTPVTQLLPTDFGPFGQGVETVTIRNLLTQQTGLATFNGAGLDAIGDPTTFRNAMIYWLGQPQKTPAPMPGQNWPAEYQNAHFDLLAIVMNEVVLPPVVLTPNPWRDWINSEVLANADVGQRRCGGDSSAGDALSYPYLTWPNGIEWMDNNYPCAGYGTGAAMFWLSPRDLAKVADAVRRGNIISAMRTTEMFAIGMGLDKSNNVTNYGPWSDGNSSTKGDQIHFKNGGIGSWTGSELAGTETLLAFYDDTNFDDDCVCGPGTLCSCASPGDGPENDEYEWELGYRDFNFGIAINSSPILSTDPCLSNPNCGVTRQFPTPFSLMAEAVQLPESW